MWGCTSQRGLYERRGVHKEIPKAPIGGDKRQCRWVPSVQTKTSSGRRGLINGKKYDSETINQWVVPYSPYLSQKFNCHINVEVCTAITAVKYLYKYVYKGSDKAIITVEAVSGEGNQTQIEPSEILRFLNA
ncbi:hypothetical protein PC110_g9799, partial [Phytophthora cactorum]